MSSFGFRILTANLANGAADAEAFADLVEAAEPDVVAVQELAPDQAEALARVLPLREAGARADPRRHGDRAPGAGERRRLRLPYRSAFVAELAWPEDDEPVEVLNVHLAAPHVHPVVQRLWDRRGQVRDVIAHLDATPRRRRVLAGDLNATPLWPAYRRLRERLGDAVEEAARRNGRRAERTWGPWYGIGADSSASITCWSRASSRRSTRVLPTPGQRPQRARRGPPADAGLGSWTGPSDACDDARAEVRLTRWPAGARPRMRSRTSAMCPAACTARRCRPRDAGGGREAWRGALGRSPSPGRRLGAPAILPRSPVSTLGGRRRPPCVPGGYRP